jgi:hypothetical protein
MGNTCITGRPGLDISPDPNAMLEKTLEDLHEKGMRANNIPRYAQARIVPVGQQKGNNAPPLNI